MSCPPPPPGGPAPASSSLAHRVASELRRRLHPSSRPLARETPERDLCLRAGDRTGLRAARNNTSARAPVPLLACGPTAVSSSRTCSAPRVGPAPAGSTTETPGPVVFVGGGVTVAPLQTRCRGGVTRGRWRHLVARRRSPTRGAGFGAGRLRPRTLASSVIRCSNRTVDQLRDNKHYMARDGDVAKRVY